MPKHDFPTDYEIYPEPGVLIAGHFLVKDTYQAVRSKGMSDWLITFTLDGEGFFIAENDQITCRKGDITLLKPGVSHHYGTSKGKEWHFLWAHFSPDLIEAKYLSDQKLINLSFENEYARTRINNAFDRLIQDYRERHKYWYELCQNSLKEILLLVAQRHTHSLDPRVEEILHLLSKRMNQVITIDDLAKEVGLSPSRLSHLFKENTGKSIMETFIQMRLNQAALLLKYTDRNATEAAAEVGFENYNHFAVQFRKRFGMSPRIYKNCKQETD